MNKKIDHTPIPARLFQTILRSMPLATVDILFFNKKMDKIALFKRTNEPMRGVYFSTGGRILKEEKIIDCAKRQAEREAGIKLKDDDLKYGGLQEELHKNSAFKDATYHAIALFYYCTVDEKNFKPTLDNQHQDFRWFSVNDKKIHPLMKSRLKTIFNKNEKGF